MRLRTLATARENCFFTALEPAAQLEMDSSSAEEELRRKLTDPSPCRSADAGVRREKAPRPHARDRPRLSSS